MEREIVKDIMFLKMRSAPAGLADKQTALDLTDTLKANSARCVGLAANMIGVRKRMIIVQTPLAPIVMLNPRIISHSGKSYEAEEGCLSLEGTRKALRHETIEVEYFDMSMKRRTGTYSGFTACLRDSDGAVIASSVKTATTPVIVEAGKLVEMSTQIQKLPAPEGLEFLPDPFQGNATKLTFTWPRVGDEVSLWNNKTYELMLYRGSKPEDCTDANRVYSGSVLRKTFNVDRYLVDGNLRVSYSNLTPDTDYIFALRLYPQVDKEVDEVQNDEDGSRRGFAASDWVYKTAHTDAARTPKADLLFSMYFDNMVFGGDMPMRAYGFQPNNKQSAKPYYPLTSIYSNSDKVSYCNPDATIEADLIHNNQYPHDFVQNEATGFGLNPSWYGDVYDGARTRTLTVPAMDGDNNGGNLPNAWCGKSINPMPGMVRVGNNYSGEFWTPKIAKITGTRDITVEFDAAVYSPIPEVGEAATPDNNYFLFSCYNAGTVTAVSKGTVEDGLARVDLDGTAFKMTHYTVTVSGATSDTQLKFETYAFNPKAPNYGRFYLDNIEVKYK